LTHVHQSRSMPARWLVLLLGTIAAGVIAAGLLGPAPAHAAANPNNYDCRGHIEAGVADPIDEDQQVKYAFACNGPILGYQIQPQIGDTGFDTDVSVFDLQGAAVTSDSFTCNGDFPGWGFNCVGSYTGPWTKVTAQFTIATPLCREPRVDPLLTVVFATADAKGKVTQAISGPYDLGRPHGCPKSALNGQTRIPKDGVLPGDTPAPKKAAAKPKTKSARKHVRATRKSVRHSS